ncbi:MAG: DNA repair protein RecN [Dethiobacter sp.]|jgi:DNA repair protein RecN (Recombination protein N)|nr:DNA repair protein RecN [Dethiobacter sp.]MCL4463570.1 DNA repair protein RecN [Bacillota bacterium]MCL5993104.1 DNA repair protein RecN [Bacillota bacterium]
MLRLLEVQNLALIDNLSFYPAEGLNVITGETGAGKSMLLGAISLLLGERATAEAIRAGEEVASMQAVFSHTQLYLDAESETSEDLSLCREIRVSGPNICRQNGRVQPLTAMSALGRRLVDLHGQNKQHSLLDPDTQRELLDRFGGAKLLGLRDEVGELYSKLTTLLREREKLGGDEAALERHTDFLRFQLTEIESAGLSAGEEEELTRRFRRLSHAQQLGAISAKLYAELYEGADAAAIVDRLGMVKKELVSATTMDDNLAEILENVVSVTNQLTEVARELRSYHDGICSDAAELHEVSLRLETYKKIIKKYGAIADMEKLAAAISLELREIEGRNQKRTSIEREINSTKETLNKQATELSSLRQKVAVLLAERINEAMQSLSLQGAMLEIVFLPMAICAAHGCDAVEFVFSANLGEPLRALAKTASGGEVSRVMLAIKSVLAEQDAVPTLIFDEIDAGIGGFTVRAVANKLRQLALHRQVICVTHQPLIAAAADHHFVIYKEEAAGRTVTRLRKLKNDERETELVRMLGGEEGAALAHARQLLQENE